MKCHECDSDRHCSALHPGPPSWVNESKPFLDHGGEHDTVSHKSDVISQCTKVCGGELTGWSCSKILLAKIYPEGFQDEAKKVYVIMDEQSNRSFACAEFFDTFNIKSPTTSYSLKTCSGTTENRGRKASGFFIESLDGKTYQDCWNVMRYQITETKFRHLGLRLSILT